MSKLMTRFLNSAKPYGLLCALFVPVCGIALAAPPDEDPSNPFRASNEVKPERAKPQQAAPPPTASRIDFAVALVPEKARRGAAVQVQIKATPRPGFHTYPATQRTEAQPAAMLSTVKIASETRGVVPIPGLSEGPPPPELVQEVIGTLLEYKLPFTWSQEIAVLPEVPPGTHRLNVEVKLQVCDDKTCVWGTHHFTLPLVVDDGEAVALPAAVEQRLREPEPPIRIVPVPGAVTAAAPVVTAPKSSGLWAFMLAGVFWGAVSLVTPCVFPMIPITVSFFLKQSEKEHHRPVTMAVVYCATIIVVLTISAVALLSLFREFSTTPILNFALGALFVFFALSLFGMYEIELPNSLARFTSAREGKGGLVGTMFMALTFTIISFACVAPFLGGFGGTAATSGITWTHRVLGGLAFSVTFASPFFILALFPTLLKQLPKSGNWLNAVKVVMGFLEFAAAIKFFRAAELVYLPEPVLFTYDVGLGLYIAVSVACGIYLLNLYRLPHDTPAEHLPVPQLILSLVFLALGLYLSPALFGHRPTGAVFRWIDSFLLPDAKSELAWKGDLNQGLESARAQRKLVFVDFTGVTCTNCKFNEANIFTRTEVKSLLAKYSLVQLYTDIVPSEFYPAEERSQFGSNTDRQRADAAKNLAFQRERFGTEQLPLYVILRPLPDGKFEEVGQYEEGKINDTTGFVNFLSKPLAAGAISATARASSE